MWQFLSGLPDLFQTSSQRVEILDEAIDALPLDRVRCADLRKIGEVWLSLPRIDDEALPRWSSFSPSMIALSLNKICILRVGDWRKDQLEFSLYGGHPTKHIGNGHPLVLEELRADPRRHANYVDIRNRAGRAVDNAAPQFARKTLSWDGCAGVEYELLMLPFMPEDGFSRVLQPISSDKRPRQSAA